MAENKTKPTKLSVAAFIDALTDAARQADAKALVKLVHSAAGEKPKMWGPSIIGFGSYHYRRRTAAKTPTKRPHLYCQLTAPFRGSAGYADCVITRSKEEVSSIALCSVRYRGQCIA